MGKKKQEEKLEAEQSKEKIIKLTLEAKQEKEGPPASQETTKAEEALDKVQGNLKFLNNEVAAEMTQATQEAVKSQEEMLKQRKAALAAKNNTGSDYQFDYKPDYNTTANLKKKCGPGVLCTTYNEVVRKAGGAGKYMTLEQEELKKLKGDNATAEETDEMKMKAFDALAEQFGIDGNPPAPKMCGPAQVPCEIYNKVKQAAGGDAAMSKKEGEEQDKLLTAAKKKDPKAELTTEMKKQAFDKIADFEGVDINGMREESSDLR